MHILRAEKSFIIVGQDTDGTVTPSDLGLDWLVSKPEGLFGEEVAVPAGYCEGGPEATGGAEIGVSGQGDTGRGSDSGRSSGPDPDQDDRTCYFELLQRISWTSCCLGTSQGRQSANWAAGVHTAPRRQFNNGESDRSCVLRSEERAAECLASPAKCVGGLPWWSS